jgi:uncharacterized membrane-anchored protein
MEITIQNIGTAKMYMYLASILLTAVFLALAMFLISRVSYNMKHGFQSDNIKRRLIFFGFLVTSSVSVFFFQISFFMDYFRQNIPENVDRIISQLESTIIPVVIASLLFYIVAFTLLAFTAQRWVGYKHSTVLKAKGKWLGIF